MKRRDEPAHSHATTRMLCASIVVLIVMLAHAFFSTPASGHTAPPKHHLVAPCASPHTTPDQAITCVWPRNLRAKARRVAECESTASAPEHIARQRHLGRWAADSVSGTHIGVFQEGEPERAAHGRYRLGGLAMPQVASAYDLYQDRGWTPWEASRHCWGHG